MKFTIKKANGTVLTKDVDSKDVNYINQLKRIGWKEESKPKPKKNKKK